MKWTSPQPRRREHHLPVGLERRQCMVSWLVHVGLGKENRGCVRPGLHLHHWPLACLDDSGNFYSAVVLCPSSSLVMGQCCKPRAPAYDTLTLSLLPVAEPRAQSIPAEREALDSVEALWWVGLGRLNYISQTSLSGMFLARVGHKRDSCVGSAGCKWRSSHL